MKAIIIEDETKTRESLKYLLSKYCPEVSVYATADNFQTAYELIREEHPSLLFVDIQLNSSEGTGIDLINTLQLEHCAVIFISGHKDFAVDAFRLRAADYLLKPIRIDQLIEAVQKATKYLEQKKGNVVVKDESKSENFHIPTQKGIIIIRQNEIIRCEADGAYTHFYVKGKKERITSSINIGQIETKLGTNFLRVHKSHILNKDYVVSYSKGEGLIVKTIDMAEIPVSRTQRDVFFKWLS